MVKHRWLEAGIKSSWLLEEESGGLLKEVCMRDDIAIEI